MLAEYAGDQPRDVRRGKAVAGNGAPAPGLPCDPHVNPARAELRHSETAGRHAEFLSHMLYPEKALQEREIAGIYFVARYGRELLHNLYETIHTSCHDHQIISL